VELVRAIVIAAGRGSRMGPLTESGPKGLLRIGESTLLQRSVDMVLEAGVREVVIVRGYMADQVQIENARYVENPHWETSEVLHSIFCAKDFIEGDLLILYSDIIFDKTVLEAAFISSDDIQPVVDFDWRESYEGRLRHPLEEADKVVLDHDGTIKLIGKLGIDEKEADAEFIGMLRLSAAGARRLVDAYEIAARSPGKQFGRAATFRRAYLTDLLQEMITSGVQMKPIKIRGGWREIDTQEDLDRAKIWFNAR
jgi:phosphoenolpyruvate phosphomutase